MRSVVVSASNPLPVFVSATYRNDLGGGKEALELYKKLKDVKDHFRQPYSALSLERSLGELDGFLEELSVGNWDGFEAEPISKGAAARVKLFLELLPAHIPMPEIIPEPDGNIGLEWEFDGDFWLIFSFSGDGTIHYVGSFGKGIKAKGSEFFSFEIPSEIAGKICRLFREAK